MQDIQKGPNQHQGNYIKHVPKNFLFAQNQSIGSLLSRISHQMVLKTRVICSLEEHVVHKMGPLFHQSNCMGVIWELIFSINPFIKSVKSNIGKTIFLCFFS